LLCKQSQLEDDEQSVGIDETPPRTFKASFWACPEYHSDDCERGNSMTCLIPSVGDLCTNPNFKPTFEAQYCFAKYMVQSNKASEWAQLEFWIYLDHEVILEI
jgi:hypothetical protein